MKIFNIRYESFNHIYYVENFKMIKLHKYYDSSKYVRNLKEIMIFN
jgi:hypothetical protein